MSKIEQLMTDETCAQREPKLDVHGMFLYKGVKHAIWADSTDELFRYVAAVCFLNPGELHIIQHFQNNDLFSVVRVRAHTDEFDVIIYEPDQVIF